MSQLVTRASRSLRRRWSHAQSNAHIRRLNREIADNSHTSGPPVIFFNASTRLSGLSLNAAFGLTARWALNLAGTPVVNFACNRGLSRCVLGTNQDDMSILPPCAECVNQSKAVYAHSPVEWSGYQEDSLLKSLLSGLSLDDLMSLRYQGVPLGELVLPSMRWILRRHHLIDDENTRLLYHEYLLSAWQVVREFSDVLDRAAPLAVVVFNGMFYPEASARWAARQRGIRVISHEVGLRPFTAFFTHGDATAYPIEIDPQFELNDEQNRILDDYLEKRMHGNFSMAGVRFWPEMKRLDQKFLDRAALYRQIVPVFTNVIFDTSQPHSNVVFPHMFAWLDSVVDLAREHPDTLFVIRAHPDEARPGKSSRESVAHWVQRNQVLALPNIIFIQPQEYLSSYELIQRSKFVMVYNSTIGLEASLMGAPVLCGGRARFTQIPTVFFPGTVQAYIQKAEEFLAVAQVDVPAEFRCNARRFLYYQLYRSSLPFDTWLEDDGVWQGYVRFKDLDYHAFDPQRSPVLRTVVDGILQGTEFLLND